MTLRDFKEITVCALLTAIVIVGALGARAAVSVAPPDFGRPLTVDGLTLTAAAKRSAKPYTVEVTIRAANPSDETKKLDINLALIRTDFAGNPMSRLMSPKDYAFTTERTNELKLTVPGRQAREKTILLPVDSRRPEGPAKPLTMPPTYRLDVVQGDAALSEGETTPPTSIVSLGSPMKDTNTLTTFGAALAWPDN
jgi:hypothetical protein